MKMTTKRASRGIAYLLGATALVGCVQMPTEKQNALALKPQVSFRLAHESLGAAVVVIDGLSMGVAGQFQHGQAALEVQPGTHQLSVQLNDRTLIDEKFYVGDGVTKTFDLR